MIDIIFVAIIILTAYIGAKRGLIRTLMGVLTTAVSAVLSMVLYRPVALILSDSGVGNALRVYIEKIINENAQNINALMIQSTVEASTRLVVDAISFAVVIILSKIIISVVARAMNIVAKFPLIRQANSLLGLVLGVISGILICYISIGILGAAVQYETAENIVRAIENSNIALYFYQNNVITDILS